MAAGGIREDFASICHAMLLYGNYDGIYKDILQIDGYFYLKDL